MATESEGLKKLTEYLNQIRKQAENSIDFLNTRIKELQGENEDLSAEIKTCKEERDALQHTVDQLRKENNTKWKLQERDDWRAMVEKLQADRKRVQDECAEANRLLAESREEIEEMRRNHAMALAHAATAGRGGGGVVVEEDDASGTDTEDSTGSPPSSQRRQKAIAANVNLEGAGAGSDAAVVLRKSNATEFTAIPQLQQELQRVYAQLQQQEAQRAAERKTHNEEIRRLKEQLHHLKYHDNLHLPPGIGVENVIVNESGVQDVRPVADVPSSSSSTGAGGGGSGTGGGSPGDSALQALSIHTGSVVAGSGNGKQQRSWYGFLSGASTPGDALSPSPTKENSREALRRYQLQQQQGQGQGQGLAQRGGGARALILHV